MRISKFLLVAFALLLASCGPNQGVLKDGRPSSDKSAAAPTRSQFEQDLNDIRDADYPFVYVLRRKDGAVMDAEDRSFIRANILYARSVMSDEGRAVLVGSNEATPPDKMMAIYARFAVENYAKEQPANVKP